MLSVSLSFVVLTEESSESGASTTLAQNMGSQMIYGCLFLLLLLLLRGSALPRSILKTVITVPLNHEYDKNW